LALGQTEEDEEGEEEELKTKRKKRRLRILYEQLCHRQRLGQTLQKKKVLKKIVPGFFLAESLLKMLLKYFSKVFIC